jgi:phosphoglycolate phosphatase
MMTKSYDLFVFDWDGTLSDSAAHIVTSLQASARDLDLPVPSELASRHIIGLGLEDALMYLFPGLPRERYRDVAERYKVHYLAGETHLSLFEGVEDGLRTAQAAGRLLAVATGKSRRGLDRALDTTGLKPFFDASRCADEGFAKPHPDMLEYLLDHLGVSAERALMIGDTIHDVEMAHGARMDVIAVTYGAHDPEKLDRARPTYTVRSPRELWQWLNPSA